MFDDKYKILMHNSGLGDMKENNRYWYTLWIATNRKLMVISKFSVVVNKNNPMMS